jgi:hypothetical protein
LILGAGVGAIAGAILGAAGVGLNAIKLVCGGLGFLIGIPVSYFLFRVFVGGMIVRRVQTFYQQTEPGTAGPAQV